jgi:hypothetical protein
MHVGDAIFHTHCLTAAAAAAAKMHISGRQCRTKDAEAAGNRQAPCATTAVKVANQPSLLQ